MKTFYSLIGAVIFLASCNPETCNDGIQNQDETGVDCGGVCLVCETCSDGIKNQDEVSTDCGGMNCPVCDISYLPTGTYGDNVLYGSDTLYLPVGDYSFQAEMFEGSSLKIVFQLVSGSPWFYAPSSNNGWSINSYNNGTQTFELLNPGNYNVNLHLAYGADPGDTLGSFNMNYYENSTSVTKTKHISWY